MKKVLIALLLPFVFACGAGSPSQAGETTATDSTESPALGKETESPQTVFDAKQMALLAGFWHLKGNPSKKMIIYASTEKDPMGAVLYDGTTIEYNGQISATKNGFKFTYFLPQSDTESGSLEWKDATISEKQMVFTVEGEQQVWENVERSGIYEDFSPQSPLLGSWDLDMESDQVRMVFNLEDFVEDPEKYPQYSQYDNEDQRGGRFFPQMYVRTGMCNGEKNLKVSKNQDDFGPERCLLVKKDKRGKPSIFHLVLYEMGEVEDSYNWYVLDYDFENLTLVEESNKLLIKFYKKN
jgi:autonomous glycyl radical cofactor GrcA